MPLNNHHPIEFADQDWNNPNLTLEQYANAVSEHNLRLATVKDLEREEQFDEVMQWADVISKLVSEAVLIIPKVKGIIDRIPDSINGKPIRLAYSVATGGNTQYAKGTSVNPKEFGARPTHLLGGSPQRQMKLFHMIENVVSLDGNFIQKMANYPCGFFCGNSGNYSGYVNRHFPLLSESKFSDIHNDVPYFCFELSVMNWKSYWNRTVAGIRWGVESDIVAIKQIANQHPDAIGYLRYPSLRDSIAKKELIVAEHNGSVVGFCRFHLRRDGWITIYEIAVDQKAQMMGNRVGSGLIASLPASPKRATCVYNNEQANQFFNSLGFQLIAVKDGKKRPLHIWEREIEKRGTPRF